MSAPEEGPRYTWSPDRDGFGTLLDAEKSGEGSARGFRVVHNGIKYEDAVERFGNVEKLSNPIPLTVTACGFCDEGIYRDKKCPYCGGSGIA